jgi:hypothetical protein
MTINSPITWHTGIGSYKKHTIHNPENTDRLYSIEFLDAPTHDDRSMFRIFDDHVQRRQTKEVEVLFSGGLDSELVLYACMINHTPIRAITMRLLIDGIPVNVYDLYYSEKFCREYNIKQTIVDLDVLRFFENGEHEKYLEPYRITQPHVATHFWLLEQCSGFPVVGGEYPWPWQGDRKVFSPIRYEYSQYDRFLADRGIDGIGSMLDHSLDSATLIAKTHMTVIREQFPNYVGTGVKAAKFKAALYDRLGYAGVQARFRGYGWESIRKDDFSKQKYQLELTKKHGLVTSSIVWNTKLAQAVGFEPGSNSQF